jgi:hypothetical protein
MVGLAQSAEINGTVRRVDVPSGTVFFTDGRVVRLTPGARLYVGNREVRLADVQPGWVLVSSGPTLPTNAIVLSTAQPGAVVFVRNAEPLAFQPATSPAVDRPFQMGTVSGVDASNARVILSDGSLVQLRPGAQAIFNGQPLAITELRAGDEVVIGVPSGGTVAVAPAGAAVSALPRQALGIIEVEYVYVVRRPQAP